MDCKRCPTTWCMAIWLCMMGVQQAWAQSPVGGSARLEFDVASVRQNKSDERPHSNFPLNPGPQYSPSGGRLTATNMLLLQYIVFAYVTTSYQIQGIRAQLPDWARTEHFDIDARVGGEPSKDEMRLMMQSLLEDRFGLRVHHETRQVPVFGLTLAKPGKLGPRLQAHPADDLDCTKTSLPTVAADAYPAACGVGASIAASAVGLIALGGRRVSMEMFALGLTNISIDVPRPVIDQTGLKGGFDYTLEWVPDGNGPSTAGAATDEAGATFVQALREQLGLKLVPEKGPTDVILLDHVEQPSAN
jgi:uncharacterized protein (TIGR03435 family)